MDERSESRQDFRQRSPAESLGEPALRLVKISTHHRSFMNRTRQFGIRHLFWWMFLCGLFCSAIASFSALQMLIFVALLAFRISRIDRYHIRRALYILSVGAATVCIGMLPWEFRDAFKEFSGFPGFHHDTLLSASVSLSLIGFIGIFFGGTALAVCLLDEDYRRRDPSKKHPNDKTSAS